MKTLLISLLIIITPRLSSPDKMSKKILKIIKSSDIESIDQYYLTKDEFITLIEEMSPKPPEEQTSKMLEDYDLSREAYLESFEENITSINWNTTTVDSLKYDYVFAKPGSDEKILWPESKDYQVNDSDLVKVSMLFSLHDAENNYAMKLEMMNYKGNWKFIFWLKPPFIYTL